MSVSGELHVSNGAPSSEHSNASRWAGVALSVAKNSNVASWSPVWPLGPERIPVPGPVVACVEVQV